MARRARVEDAPPEEPKADESSLIPGIGQWDSTLENLIDERFRHVLSLSTNSKDLVNALKEAVNWIKTKRDMKEEPWGKALGGTMR